MRRELPILVVLGAILLWSGVCWGAASDPSLIGWWRLDEAGGAVAIDSSGHGNSATLIENVVRTTALYGRGVYCDGTGGYIAMPDVLTATCTLAFWFKPDWDGTDTSDYRLFDASNADKYFFISKGAVHDVMTAAYFGFFFEDSTDADFQNVRITAAGAITAGTWYHVAATWQFPGTAILYLNGVEISRGTNLGAFATLATTPRFGHATGGGGVTATHGAAAVFDDIKIFDRVLGADEIPGLMEGAALELASAPKPADEATDVPRETVLTWVPGATAATHDVYFGTTFEDVNNASRTAPAGLLVSQGQDANTYDPPGVLAYGQTYYWRVDEVNAPPSNTIFKGTTWSFTVEPLFYAVTGIVATASSFTTGMGPEKTINGSGLNASDLHNTDRTLMWLTAKGTKLPAWIQYDLGRVRKLESMMVWNYNVMFEDLIGIGAKDVQVEYSTDAATWTPLSGVSQFEQGPGADGYAANTTADFGGAPARYVKITINSNWGGSAQTGLSEVRFLETVDYARQPAPASGATGVSPDVTFSWRAGRQAVTHQVYTGTDPNALTLAGTASTTHYAPGGLLLGTQYYWRVDEVNSAEAIPTWAGDVWSFQTSDYVVVDDMESYNDTDGTAIYNAWADGYGSPTTNGGLSSYDTAPFAEKTSVHGGKQAMPFRYGQSTAATSEVTRTFTPAQDWTKAGIQTLTLFFYGDPNNGAASLYLKINSTKIAYDGDAGNVQRHRWNQWNIDLSTVAASTLKSVNTLLIGVSNGTSQGILLIDDIRLYRVAPAIPVAVNPGTTGLIAYYAMSNNVQDSSGNGNNGTLVGTPTYAAGLSALGTALRLNGTTDCVDLGNKAAFNPAASLSITLWAYIESWGTAWNHVMVGNRGEDNVGWQVRRHSSTSLCFTTRGVGNDDMASVAVPPQNDWVHVACVYDNAANTKTIYINGLLDSVVTTTAGAKIAATTHKTYIGARATSANTGPEAFFTGLLDEVRIFNRVLTAGEVEFLSDPTP